ncbi:hypothetical protein [Paludibaculum fermentans]|uniref:hypothetical protein n=1 Tax=Paludibaculum fermentans TaxID=1473598 RepID=UPI003EB6C9F2
MRRIVGWPLGLLLSLGSLGAQPAGKGLDLGRQWKVHQWILPAANLDGKWTRIGTSNDFDVDYTNRVTKLKVYSRVTVVSRTATKIVISIPKSNAKLVGNFGMDGRTIRGTLEPCPPGSSCGWSAETDIQPPQAEVARKKAETRGLSTDDLGTIWRVHDFTNEDYDYYGTWTMPKPGTDAIEFSYKNKADGAVAKGSFVIGTLSGRVLLIFHQGRRKYMRGTIQADGKTVKGTADWCRNPSQCGWEATILK